MDREKAETLALDALGWLAAEEDVLRVFQGASGLSSDDLRVRATEPDLLAAVLDFVLADDASVMRFAEATGRAPQDVLRARAVLPGGDSPNWT